MLRKEENIVENLNSEQGNTTNQKEKQTECNGHIHFYISLCDDFRLHPLQQCTIEVCLVFIFHYLLTFFKFKVRVKGARERERE